MIGKTPLRFWKHFNLFAWIVVAVILFCAFAASASADNLCRDTNLNACVSLKNDPFNQGQKVNKEIRFEFKNVSLADYFKVQIFAFNTGIPNIYDGTVIFRGVNRGGKVTLSIPFK